MFSQPAKYGQTSLMYTNKYYKLYTLNMYRNFAEHLRRTDGKMARLGDPGNHHIAWELRIDSSPCFLNRKCI